MNRKVVALLLLSLGDERLDRLPTSDRRWLEEEVVYVITDAEKEVFLSLGTLEEREQFIEAFWRIRDPNRATPENERRAEHYRRLEYANRNLSRETAREGWKTDRGRMYVILGEPQQITRFEAHNDIVPIELWLYPADPSKGLPTSFNLLFFRKKGFGEYELFSPILDGANALLNGYQYTPGGDNAESIRILQRISPELARASLSLDLGEPADFVSRRPAMGTDILLSRIESSAKRSVATGYADAHLRYRDRVSADYSFRYVANQKTFVVLYGPEGTPFVHYSIELAPEDFALEAAEDGTKLYTTLDVTWEARSASGAPVARDDQEVFLEIAPSQFQEGGRLPFAYQDAFPLVPGDYQVSVVLRNRVVKQYTVAEAELRIPPAPSDTPALGDLVLGYLHETPFVDDDRGFVRPFQIGSDRIYPAAQNLFPIGAKVVVFVQVQGEAKGCELRSSLLDGATTLLRLETEVKVGHAGISIESSALPPMAGGSYALRAQLLDREGRVVSERSVELVVSPREHVPRPGFIYRRGFPAGTPGFLAMKRGEQHWSLGEIDAATAELARAVEAGNPDLPEASWKLAGVLLSTGRAERALALLEPMEERFPHQFEVVGGLGYAHYFQGNYDQARELLERAAALRPPDTTLLNALGGSYRQVGELANAAEAYRRSLALDPQQEEVRRLLERISPQRPER